MKTPPLKATTRCGVAENAPRSRRKSVEVSVQALPEGGEIWGWRGR